jgi:hypothetical protein
MSFLLINWWTRRYNPSVSQNITVGRRFPFYFWPIRPLFVQIELAGGARVF